MNLSDARHAAAWAMLDLIEKDITTETLNEIENRVNSLILNWSEQNFFVYDNNRKVINGVKLRLDPFDMTARINYRYPKVDLYV